MKRVRDGINNTMTIKTRRYINHVMKDPLPGFEGERNWLYSGGTVTASRDEFGSTSIVSSCGVGMSSVCKIKLEII